MAQSRRRKETFCAESAMALGKSGSFFRLLSMVAGWTPHSFASFLFEISSSGSMVFGSIVASVSFGIGPRLAPISVRSRWTTLAFHPLPIAH